MMEVEDWEKRQDNIPFKVHMIAGCLAGLVEHISMLPLDNVKTHLQVLPDSRFWSTFKSLKQHGLRMYFSGTSAVTAGCMPAHAFYFSSYELLKSSLNIDDEQHHPLEFALIGAISTLWHDIIMNPFDVVKQRQQLLETPLIKTIKRIVKLEGPRALYRSFPVSYLMNAPFQAIFFASNETIRVLVSTKENHTFASHFLCAALAGTIAVTTINPLDVVKTKLQTQTCHLKSSLVKYHNISDTVRTIKREEGIRGFYKGLGPRLCMQTLSGATAWASYEFIKGHLLKQTHN